MKRTLSADSLFIIKYAIEFTDGNLDKLHWQCVSFGATDSIYRNIADYRSKLEKAKKELCELFESQFDVNP